MAFEGRRAVFYSLSVLSVVLLTLAISSVEVPWSKAKFTCPDEHRVVTLSNKAWIQDFFEFPSVLRRRHASGAASDEPTHIPLGGPSAPTGTDAPTTEPRKVTDKPTRPPGEETEVPTKPPREETERPARREDTDKPTRPAEDPTTKRPTEEETEKPTETPTEHEKPITEKPHEGGGRRTSEPATPPRDPMHFCQNPGDKVPFLVGLKHSLTCFNEDKNRCVRVKTQGEDCSRTGHIVYSLLLTAILVQLGAHLLAVLTILFNGGKVSAMYALFLSTFLQVLFIIISLILWSRRCQSSIDNYFLHVNPDISSETFNSDVSHGSGWVLTLVAGIISLIAGLILGMTVRESQEEYSRI